MWDLLDKGLSRIDTKVMYRSAVVIPAFNEQEWIGWTMESLRMQRGLYEQHALVIVNNNSTDETQGVIEAFGPTLGNFDVHTIAEEQKGTGAAADTGFQYAIGELGVTHVARLDADTIPMPFWLGASLGRYDRNPRTRLVTGPSLAGFDPGGTTFAEAILLPRVKTIGKIVKVVQHRTIGMLRFAPGHNMSTTSQAYIESGGFPRLAIEEASDDIEYVKKVSKLYGFRAMAYERQMTVFTSQRRLRALGYMGSLGYYISDNPVRRKRLTNDAPDIR